LGVRGVEVVEIVDIYHAYEYLWVLLIEAVFEQDPRQSWWHWTP